MRGKLSLGQLPKDKKPSLDTLRDYPGMTGWFNPSLLLKLLWQVIVSDLFGQYADRRLLEAALDPVAKEAIPTRDDISQSLKNDNDGAVWIDFVADLGDGFDATYAVAYLLAQENLTIDKLILPRGGALFMGGDEVYPTASRDEYNSKMRAPYQFAFPDQPKTKEHPAVFAIPGNHDWYDGLVNFLAFFARAKPTHIGNWRTQQNRSYFSVKLTDQCWVWGIDIALVADMDQPQADYFVAASKEMPQGAQVILCSAEPGWYKVDSDSYRTLSYATWIAENAGKSLHIPLVLSGDTHHYARYTSSHGIQYITAGGGGAFLHGTHNLPKEIEAKWLRYSNEKLHLQSSYPTFETSKKLLKGNFGFPLLNFGFSTTLGAVYALMGYILSLVPRPDLALILFGLFSAGLVSYVGYQERFSKKVVLLSTLHSAIHFIAMVAIVCSLISIDQKLLSFHENGPWWAWLLTLGIPTVLGGGLIAGLIFGANLFFTCKYADMNHNDAFSAMRLDSFRHFLRLRIVGDQITVFPIGFDRTPKRAEWQDNPETTTNPTASYFLPPNSFQAVLIEPPIVISGSATAQTADIRKPSEMPRE